MNFEEYRLDDAVLCRYDQVYNTYKQMYGDPDHREPKFIAVLPSEYNPVWEERLADPAIMLKAELESLKPHIEAEDDAVLSVRVQFGTAVVAEAFGCEIAVPPNNLPCAKTHVVTSLEQIPYLEKPSKDCPIYRKVRDWTEYYVEHIPEGYQVQLADIQGPFNTAHLIRGNDIFYDLYDDPEMVQQLMAIVTDHIADYASWQWEWTNAMDGWFFDWGAMWKGNGRISNCSLHMLGTEHYEEHIHVHDVELIRRLKGGRIHYCGPTKGTIERIAAIPGVNGIAYDSSLHDVEETAQTVPDHVALLQDVAVDSPLYNRMLNSDRWPIPKRNMIFRITGLKTPAQAKEVIARLRRNAENS